MLGPAGVIFPTRDLNLGFVTSYHIYQASAISDSRILAGAFKASGGGVIRILFSSDPTFT